MRSPSSKEVQILSLLLKKAGLDFCATTLEVEPMNDGRMGSLKIGKNHELRSFGSQVAEEQYTDNDGVPFIASLYLDKEGIPYELDIWKVDFSETEVLNGNS